MPEFNIVFEQVVVPFDEDEVFSYEIAVRAWQSSRQDRPGRRKVQIRSRYQRSDTEVDIKGASSFDDRCLKKLMHNAPKILELLAGKDVPMDDAGKDGDLGDLPF